VVRANHACVDVVSEPDQDGDDMWSIVHGGVVHRRHAGLVVFAQSRRRTGVTQSCEYGHVTTPCGHMQSD